MKYKVGDRVRIKSIDWYNENKGNADETNSVWCEDGFQYLLDEFNSYEEALSEGIKEAVKILKEK